MAQQYKRTEDAHKRKKLGQEIFDRFIAPNSEQPLNLDPALLSDIAGKYARADENSWDDANMEVEKKIMNDIFLRFTESRLWRNYYCRAYKRRANRGSAQFRR
eukprot:GEZU01008943.1.p2 GENE.GEZU01008943.1~~GEZU01008943.1.p2  ORF type:complete len:103 (+),score=23.51 GEZU01008943.1:390-698(+)